MALRALIWDVDGTLAETERDGHRVAFNDAFAAISLRPGALRLMQQALAIEDSPQGVASARAAGIGVLLVRSAYFAGCTSEGAIAVCAGLDASVSARGISDGARVDWPWLCDLHRHTLRAGSHRQAAY